MPSPPAHTETSSQTTETAASEADDHQAEHMQLRARWRRITPTQLVILTGLAIAMGIGTAIGVLGVRTHQASQSADLRAQYLQAGRQGAVNLTTIDWRHADADVERILASATGSFHDDFSARSQPFIEVVKKVQSTSTGNVTAAGLETSADTDAQVLVAVSVQTTTGNAPATSRAWRMRLSVQRVGADVKVSNVEFVP